MIISEDPWRTTIAEGMAAELLLPVLMTKVCRGWDLNTKPSTYGGKRPYPLRHRLGSK